VTADVFNRQRQLIHDRHIQSIAKIESWPMHGIVKNAISRLIHKSAVKTVTIDLEIINEYWVRADVCNRQSQLIHDRRMKSIEKIKSWLTHGIVKNAMSLLMHKSSAKTKSLSNLKSSIKVVKIAFWLVKSYDFTSQNMLYVLNRLKKLKMVKIRLKSGKIVKIG
jgi:predicted RNA binding protein with dsRBD fold (UPF0201 family)